MKHRCKMKSRLLLKIFFTFKILIGGFLQFEPEPHHESKITPKISLNPLLEYLQSSKSYRVLYIQFAQRRTFSPSLSVVTESMYTKWNMFCDRENTLFADSR